MSELILWVDKEINKMRQEMDRLFQSFWPEIGVCLFQKKVSQQIEVETFMTDKAFVIRASLPGVDAKSLDIRVTDYQLTIKGSKKEEPSEENGYCYQMQCKLRAFTRTVPLPFKVSPDEIRATLNMDVLTIQMARPDPRRDQAVKIEIT